MINAARPTTRRIVALSVVVLLATGACASASTGKKSTAGAGQGATSTKPVTSASTTRSTATTGVASASQGSKVEPAATYAVGSLQETYVDRSRTTKKNGTAPALPERTLPTLVLYPAQGNPSANTSVLAKPVPGPWPLVVFSHGVTGKGTFYATTLRVLASAGYVVIAPDYPLSKGGAPGGPSIQDVPEQTRDIAFLIDRVLAASKTSSGRLSGLIDSDRIGLAGHSLGAITSLGAGYNACCAERRVKAVAEWAGIFFPLESGGKVAAASKGRPLLILHGTADGTVPYRSGQAVYNLLGPPKYFITLPGAQHIPPYLQGLGSAQSKVVTLATLDFFDRYLKGDQTGIDRLHKVVTDAGATNATEQEVAG